jgi:hypothetical protein
LEQARNAASGPSTCNRFEGLHPDRCKGCPHKGKIASPIKLGETPSDPADAPRRAAQETAIAQFNEKHFILTIGGSTRIGELTRDAFGHDGVLVLSTERDFRLRYKDRRHAVTDGNGSSKVVSLADYWLGHPDRRQYGGVTLEPGQPRDLPNGWLNLWSGFGVTPRKGDWSLMRRHVTEILAGGDPKDAEYILRHAAWLVQNPGKRSEVALVFKGGKGCGKGIFLRALAKIFGQHGLQISDPRYLVGNFNAHLRNCLFLYADEAFWAGDKRGEAVLKSNITEPSLTIEQKGVDAVKWPNRLSIALASNSDWVVPASDGERRYAVFACDNRYVGGQCSDAEHKAYFDPLYYEMENGGIEAMLGELLSTDLGVWHPRQVYETHALQEQKAQSLSGYNLWWEGLLQEGRLPGSEGIGRRGNLVTTRALALDAQERSPTLRLRGNDTLLGRFLNEHGCTRRKMPRGDARGWHLPQPADARKAWEAQYGPWPWRDPDLAEWA